MTIFELVNVVLQSLYKEAKQFYGAKTDDAIRDRMAYLSQTYAKLNVKGRIPVDYKDPATRFAYVYKYVASHADYLVQILKSASAAIGGPLFPDGTLRLSCIGGGPGSDIIGVLKYLKDVNDAGNKEGTTKLICYLLDKEKGWADTWTELDEHIDLGVQLNTNFQPLDVLNASSWEAQRKFLQADVFTLSYFVSEVMALDTHGQVGIFWNTLFAEAKPGAIFVYNDNGHTDFSSYFDSFWKAAGLKEIVAEDDHRIVPSYSEQASELAAFIKKFDQFPKLKGQVSYRVLRKPDK